MTAPSESVSEKLNYTVYAVYAVYMLFSIKKIAQSKPIHFSMLIRALKWEKAMGQK